MMIQCGCQNWANAGGDDMAQQLLTGHHPQCVKGDFRKSALGLIADLAQALEAWGREEDGIPEFAWEPYRRAKALQGVFLEKGYRLYRGRCKELSEAACANDSTLKLVRGHYYCPIWNRVEPHWWTTRPDGTIHDPTREQFPSRGLGVYTPFNGIVSCAECGKEVAEEDASFDGNYAFCSSHCHGRFVGVF